MLRLFEVCNMNVLYTCDNNYVWLMGISMISLFENNKHIEELNVYLIGENIGDSNKGILQEITQKYDRKLYIINTPKLDIPESLTSERWPLSAFTRLFSGQLLPQDVERILYLDCDTIVKGDLKVLETININDKIFYGVRDCISSNYKRNISLQTDSTYINAGVLLINLSRLRKVNITKALDGYMKKNAKLINYADQDILNGVFENQIGVLNPKYNVMTIDIVHSYREICVLRRPTAFYSEEEIMKATANPVVIHYTTNMRTIRPWYKNADHPLNNEFLKYMEMSPWKEKELTDFEFSTMESKVIKFIMLFPKKIAYRILGGIHSYFKPIYIRLKAKYF